jgi:hypothetical protein
MRTPSEAGGLIGLHLQAFFAEHLLGHKRASPQTIACYRDTFRLLLRFMQAKTGTEPSALPLAALDADAVLAFLDHLERNRGCSVRSTVMLFLLSGNPKGDHHRDDCSCQRNPKHPAHNSGRLTLTRVGG